MPRLSKLLEKLEDRIANKWGRWCERNKARAPLYAVLGGIGWYLYGMFLNSLKLGKESVFNTTGEVIESIWVFNPFKNLFAVFTPFGIGVTAFIALMVCLITKKGYSWFSGYKFTRDARGFDILPDGTHGTSGFATKKELAEHLELGSAEEVILPVSHRSKIRTIPVRRLSRRMNRKYAVQEPRIWRVLLTGNPQQHAKNRRICCPRIVKIALQELQNPRSQNRRN